MKSPIRTLFLVALAVCASTPAWCQASTGKDPAVFASTVLTSDTGQKVRLSDLRGKVVFLNYWGAWCPPCREEMASIRTMQTKLQDRANAIEYLFVSIKDDWFDRDAAKFRELGMAGHAYRWEPRSDAQWHTFFGNPPGKTSFFVPTTYVLDPSGNIAMMRAQTTAWEVHTDEVRALFPH